VHIEASFDVEDSIADLNASHHGSAVLWPGSFQPFYFEDGWDDWARVDLKPVPLAARSSCGIRFWKGGLKMLLPAAVTLRGGANERRTTFGIGIRSALVVSNRDARGDARHTRPRPEREGPSHDVLDKKTADVHIKSGERAAFRDADGDC
jgi:hypothetical protein